jgi:hypothetical protein
VTVPAVRALGGSKGWPVESERLIGLGIVWAAVWIGTAIVLAGSSAFGMLLPVLIGGSAGTLIVATLPLRAAAPRLPSA